MSDPHRKPNTGNVRHASAVVLRDLNARATVGVVAQRRIHMEQLIVSPSSVRDTAVLDELRKHRGSRAATVAKRLLTLARDLGADVLDKKESISVRLPGRAGASTKEVTLFFIAKKAGTFWIHDEYLRRWPSAGVSSDTMRTYDSAIVRLFGRRVKSRQMNDLSKAVPLTEVEPRFQELEVVLREAALGILGKPSSAEAPTLIVDAATPTIDESDDCGMPFGDSVRNALVERAAVSYTTALYTQAGWDVDSVEDDNVGYDLVCRRGHDEEHVEVKGISGSQPIFIITANEMRSARSDPRFVLSVVTHALASPVEQRWNARDFLDTFALAPLAFRASLIGDNFRT